MGGSQYIPNEELSLKQKVMHYSGWVLFIKSVLKLHYREDSSSLVTETLDWQAESLGWIPTTYTFLFHF